MRPPPSLVVLQEQSDLRMTGCGGKGQPDILGDTDILYSATAVPHNA